MHSLLSYSDIEKLKFRQQSIADEMENLEYEREEEVSTAQSDYFSNINVLYTALGENTPCAIIDPMLYNKFKSCYNNDFPTITRREVLVKLGSSH